MDFNAILAAHKVKAEARIREAEERKNKLTQAPIGESATPDNVSGHHSGPQPQSKSTNTSDQFSFEFPSTLTTTSVSAVSADNVSSSISPTSLGVSTSNIFRSTTTTSNPLWSKTPIGSEAITSESSVGRLSAQVKSRKRDQSSMAVDYLQRSEHSYQVPDNIQPSSSKSHEQKQVAPVFNMFVTQPEESFAFSASSRIASDVPSGNDSDTDDDITFVPNARATATPAQGTLIDLTSPKMVSKQSMSSSIEFATDFKPKNDPFENMVSFIPGNKRQKAKHDISDYVEDFKLTPLFSRRVDAYVQSALPESSKSTSTFTQFGLLGLNEESYEDLLLGSPRPATDNLIFANMDAPWSAFICGSQGAGKSHTLSCLLENALLRNSEIGSLSNPLAGLVFHYDRFASQTTSQICEAAYLCSSGIPVTVLASPSNIWAMQTMYSNMPGIPAGAPKPKVLPLYLTEKQLDVSRMMKLMAVDPSSEATPLYMEIVMNILREMAMAGSGSGGFSYTDFRNRIQAATLLPGQKTPLSLRLSLLESILAPSHMTSSTRPAAAKEDIWAFPQGSLTIVDLSDPFVDENDACALFSICLSLFLEKRTTCGRIVALDEAHKFLTRSGEAKTLTDSLTSVIREQRHTGTRVVIATQEPTLSETLIDLSNVTIVHRFISPSWYDILSKHIAGTSKEKTLGNNHLFKTIVALETGQALVFCPTALLEIDENAPGASAVKPLRHSYAKVRIRSRITTDGGRSVMASGNVTDSRTTTTLDVPMHVVTKPPPPLFKASHGKSGGQSSGTSRSGGTTNPKPTTNPATDSSQQQEEKSLPANTTSHATTYDLHVGIEVRKIIESGFAKERWHSIQGIPWSTVEKKIERGLKLPINYISDNNLGTGVRKVARAEVNRLRADKGWKPE